MQGLQLCGRQEVGGVPARGRAGGVQELWPGGHCVFSEFTSGQRVLRLYVPQWNSSHFALLFQNELWP